MQIENQIDKLIQDLGSPNRYYLKTEVRIQKNLPNLGRHFKLVVQGLAIWKTSRYLIATALITSWVDPDYGIDVEKSRKPNMRELIEAISGKSVEELPEAKNYTGFNHSGV